MAARVKQLFRISYILLQASLKSDLQYRANLIMTVLGGLAFQAVTLAFIWSILQRFGDLGGWTLPQIAFLYSLRLTAHGLWAVPSSQLAAVDEVMQTGEYDRYLVRPIPPLLQLLTRRVRLSSVGDLPVGLALLVITAVSAPIRWSPLLVAFVVATVVSGALIEGAIQLAAASLAFRFLSTAPLQFAIDSIFNQYGNYPLKIFTPAIQLTLTFVFPLAFVAYFPASILLGRSGDLIVPGWLAWCAPAVGAALFFIAYKFWIRQSRHYQSSGG
jgi:ABC-2 type transport system permease protein